MRVVAEDKKDIKPEMQDIYSVDTYVILTLFLGIIVEKAWQNLGLKVKPGTDKVETDLGQAKTAIDVAALLLEKLKTHLSQSEVKRLEGAIGDLKLNFVRLSK